MGWEAANARARGLAPHLLSRDALVGAAATGSWTAAARVLAGRGYPVSEPELGSRSDFDRAVGRIAARRLELLGRWLGDRRGMLAVIFEDEDRRSLRRLLRGAAQGAPPEARLLGLIPTPDLPEPLLWRLAQAPSYDVLTDTLVRAGHPAGRVLASTRDPKRKLESPGLWRAEIRLARLFATRATRAARGAGAIVRRFASLLIDLENGWTLVAAPEWGAEITPHDLYLPGGSVIDRDEFLRLARLRTPQGELWRAVAERFASTPLRDVFLDPPDPARIEGRGARALVAWQRSEARRDPLSASTALEVLLRIRAEAHDVRLVTFSLDLGAPVPVIEDNLRTAA